MYGLKGLPARPQNGPPCPLGGLKVGGHLGRLGKAPQRVLASAPATGGQAQRGHLGCCGCPPAGHAVRPGAGRPRRSALRSARSPAAFVIASPAFPPSAGPTSAGPALASPPCRAAAREPGVAEPPPAAATAWTPGEPQDPTSKEDSACLPKPLANASPHS
ncbi:nascent polypeptide-associated complex subunit alpha, muscle-specific form-like [Peromyscus eremicus]|uniref:nascent polypeptide-associated complex subunit alpha, muscle-specific form-like n=1 Tax=Peromyscus eremicus TaxID=42410 RepID=UPI0027DC9F17|nr:nascent polypeptide-associated complex subunit alpha, muscle-specific form-like [Peromyscus eremicus]